MSWLWLVPVFLVLAVVIPTVWVLAEEYAKWRFLREIRCPENAELVKMSVDTRHAILMRAVGEPKRRVKTCSRWPERRDCLQSCLRDLIR